MLFKNSNEVIPCGIFSIEHFVLLAITAICILIALKHTKNLEKNEVKKIIRKSTIILWFLEIIKIIFNIINYGFEAINKYVPLYFCSLILYAGIFSGYCKGKIKKVGDVFLSTGGIVAGITFLIIPLTSLTNYPAMHFISIHSFILHGTMVYVGLLMLITKYTIIEKKDFVYYFLTIVIISSIAYIINSIFNSNLMFISQNYPGTFIEVIYNFSKKLFPIVMVFVQATLPFWIVYGIYQKIKDENIEKNSMQINKNTEKEKILVTK